MYSSSKEKQLLYLKITQDTCNTITVSRCCFLYRQFKPLGQGLSIHSSSGPSKQCGILCSASHPPGRTLYKGLQKKVCWCSTKSRPGHIFFTDHTITIGVASGLHIERFGFQPPAGEVFQLTCLAPVVLPRHLSDTRLGSSSTNN